MDPWEVFRSLRGLHGSPHPERWVPGLQHRSIPRRPSLWRDPEPSYPPSECQLNPYLEHRSFGPPPLYFNIGLGTGGIVFYEPEGTIPLEAADRAQPATYPLLTEMYIDTVGDDPSRTFLWPFPIHNPNGILCQDVFEAICVNFEQYISQDEYDSWPESLQNRCTRSYNARLATANSWNPELSPPSNDGLRRIDYMGDRFMFRGLEPHPNDSSWTLFVGPVGPS